MRNFESVSDSLELLVDPFDGEPAEWEDVLRRAGVGDPAPTRPANARARRRWVLRAAFVVATSVAAATALLLVSPFDTNRGGVLERALAAVGTGPVLHVVLQEEWGGTVVDLATGERREIRGVREIWYDPSRGLHTISRFGGRVQSEALYGRDEIPRHEAKLFELLGDGFRAAVESGRARNLGPGAAYGIPVYWIRVDTEWLPDVADGKLHEWAHDVAVSRETFEPVATRETRDGEPGPQTGARILQLRTLAAGAGDFSAPTRAATDQVAIKESRDPIALGDAEAALGRQPLWLGPDFEGLPLARVERTTVAVGRHRETPASAQAAADAKSCGARVRQTGARSGAACDRMRQRRRSTVIRGNRVYTLRPIAWSAEEVGVALFYGATGDDPTTFRDDPVPLWDRAHVLVEQRATPPRAPVRGAYYTPREGSVFVSGQSASLVKDGVYVSIRASSEHLVLAAARALQPMPR